MGIKKPDGKTGPAKRQTTDNREVWNMKRTAKILSLILAMVFLLALAACGGGGGADADDPNLGVYKLQSLMGFSLEEYAEMMGVTADEAADSMTLELKSGGKADWTIDGETQTLDWSLEGDALTFTDGSETLEGTLADGTITMDMEGVEIVLAK